MGRDMNLTDEELWELQELAYNEACYGDDEIVYTKKGDVLRRALEKLDEEINRRGLR